MRFRSEKSNRQARAVLRHWPVMSIEGGSGSGVGSVAGGFTTTAGGGSSAAVAGVVGVLGVVVLPPQAARTTRARHAFRRTSIVRLLSRGAFREVYAGTHGLKHV